MDEQLACLYRIYARVVNGTRRNNGKSVHTDPFSGHGGTTLGIPVGIGDAAFAQMGTHPLHPFRLDARRHSGP